MTMRLWGYSLCGSVPVLEVWGEVLPFGLLPVKIGGWHLQTVVAEIVDTELANSVLEELLPPVSITCPAESNCCASR